MSSPGSACFHVLAPSSLGGSTRSGARSARVAGIRPLTRAMLWFEFRKLTDDDLGAIFEFLRSVPPVRHRVNNADPPTYCPRCARRHGLGELNPP